MHRRKASCAAGRLCWSLGLSQAAGLHRSHLPIDEMLIMVEAMRRILDFDGDRHAIGDLDELREAVDRVKAYQDFQPDRFNRRELNLQLRALAQDREVRR
jgi:hypothetical protein